MLPLQADSYSDQRRTMVQTQLRDRGITDERVLAAMQRVPRHEFIAVPFRDEAYEDHPLPIGSGQTISQPYIVASMLQALHLSASDKVLEVGAGSGYVTALLAELAAEVVSIERHEVLAAQAQQALAKLGYDRVKIVVGDGTQGFAPASPYDAIIVSAAAPQLPVVLVSQLREGGRMIVPVGPDDAQQLQLVRIENGQPQISLREPCRFVPLVSG